MTSILHFADIHFGVEDQSALAKLGATIDKLEPDISVISGDITQTGSEEEFARAAEWIAGLAGPKVITAGNHDTPMYGIIDRMMKPFDRYADYIDPLDIGLFEDENVIIQSMNTARGVQMKLDWSVGVVDLDRLDTVIARFHESDWNKLRLLNVHHPFIYPPESPLQKTTDNGPEALKRLADGNCDMVLSGHVHVPFVVERKPGGSELLSVSSGTLSTRRRDNNPAFNHIAVTADELVITMIEFDGEGFVRSEAFRKPRHELSAWRRDGYETMRKKAKILDTQPLREP
ncbi:metallophosphoesterase family protein [Algimonas porphyrae]|uniref:Metallophosphoesterase n=1 Tax=Algimonas porphyrae TaxID=1128113 RepID=A0ABQ5V0G3_9PROT|nr:metallophosphoesterase [Algimonas porphyrae]GLQ20447.1 metallophosphoesterase [Algimonas porphyrae]